MKQEPLIFYRLGHTFLVVDTLALGILSVERNVTWADLGRSLILLLPLFVLYKTVEKTRNMFVYWMVSAVCLYGLYFFSSGLGEKAGWISACVILVISYFAERVGNGKSWMEEPMLPFLVLFFGVCVYSGRYQREILEQIVCIYAGIYWILCVLSKNRRSLLELYQQNRRLHGFPKESVAAENRMVLGVMCMIGLAGMLLLPLSGADRLLLWVGRMVKRLVAALFHGEAKEMPAEEMVTGEENMLPFFYGETKEAWPWLTTLLEILEKLIFIGGVLLLLWLFIRLAGEFYRRFHQFASKEDQVEFLAREKQEEKNRMHGKREKRSLFFSGTPEERIRKSYRKEILKRSPSLPEAWADPSRIEEQAGIPQDEKGQAFHKLYEKARYSGQTCTKEESSLMKTLWKE